MGDFLSLLRFAVLSAGSLGKALVQWSWNPTMLCCVYCTLYLCVVFMLSIMNLHHNLLGLYVLAGACSTTSGAHIRSLLLARLARTSTSWQDRRDQTLHCFLQGNIPIELITRQCMVPSSVGSA